MIAENTLRPK